MHGFWLVEEMGDGRTDCGDVARGEIFCCCELQRDNSNCTYGGAEKGKTKHNTSLY